MMPDEVRRLPRNKAILLIRGSKPLMLEKITPEEFPDFAKLKTCKAIDHIPKWQQKEQEKEPCVPVAQSPSPFSESSVFPLVEEADKVSEEYVPDEEELDLDPPIDLSGGIDCKTLTETPPEEI